MENEKNIYVEDETLILNNGSSISSNDELYDIASQIYVRDVDKNDNNYQIAKMSILKAKEFIKAKNELKNKK